MKVDDLKTLSAKITAHVAQAKTLEIFERFYQMLNNWLRNNREISVSQQRDELFASLRSFDQMPLNYSEARLFRLLKYDQYLGDYAAQRIESILQDENFDPHAVFSKVESQFQDFKSFMERNTSIENALKPVPLLKDTELRAGEAILEITFTDKAAIENIVDFDDWIDTWTKIIRAFSELVGERPENSRILFVQKSSPLIVDIATTYFLVLMIGKAVDSVLTQVEKYLTIRKSVEEIKKLKLENKKIEKELAAEADAVAKKAAVEITEKLASGVEGIRPTHEVLTGVSISVEKLFVFINKGGRVDSPTTPEDKEDMGDVFKEIRKLQESVDGLRFLPAPEDKKKKS